MSYYKRNYGQQLPSPSQSANPGAPPPAGWTAPDPGYQPPPPQVSMDMGHAPPPAPPHMAGGYGGAPVADMECGEEGPKNSNLGFNSITLRQGYIYQPAPPQGSMGMGYAPPSAPPHMAGDYGGAPGADVEWGGQEPKNNNLGFSSITIRQGFIRKVFMVVSCQLAFVAALVALFVFERRVSFFVQDNSWVFHLSYATFLVTYIVLICCECVRRRFPGNIIALIIMTGSLGFVTATFVSIYNVQVVFIALAVTVVSCAAVIIFAMQTKYDFTGWVAVIFLVSIGLFLFGIIIIIFATAFKSSEIKVIWIVYCVPVTLMFLAYLAYDVQLVIGGKRYELSPEEYILAATQLFVDIVNIFFYLLQFASN